jgi:preprotein translocase subunit SecD
LALTVAHASAQDSFTTEVKLAVDRARTDVKKLRPTDTKTLEEVLKKRAPMLGAKDGKVDVRSFDDIRVRVLADKVEPSQLRMLGRPGQLELRYLENVQTSLNPKARYYVDVLSIQDKTTIRFRDRETNLPVAAPEFVRRCPLILSNADLEPDSAKVVGSGLLMAVRVRFTPRATRRLEGFTGKPGRLLAVMLDGELLSINAVTRKVNSGKKGGQKGDSDVDLSELDLSGGFGTAEEAGYLALVLNSGPLPFPLTVVSNAIVAE